MATPVVTVASGGLPVVDVTASTPKLGLPVTEALNGRGIAVTKVAGGGMPVTFSTAPDYPPPLVLVFATFDLNVSANVVRTNGNRTLNRSSTANNFDGATSSQFKSAGKYYFEIALTGPAGFSTSHCLGIIKSGATYSDGYSNGTNAAVVAGNGNLYVNGSGVASAGPFGAGHFYALAVDFGLGKVWFSEDNSAWSGSSSNPATGAGGHALPAGSYAPFVQFTFGATTEFFTLNSGATAFNGTIPAGFTGWSA